MLEKAHFEIVRRASQLYVKRADDDSLSTCIAKFTEDLLMDSSIQKLRRFSAVISKKFEISKAIIDERITFNKCDIIQKVYREARLCINRLLSRIEPIPVSKMRRKLRKDKATKSKFSTCRKLAGELIWLGSGTISQASCVSSFMLQSLPNVNIEALVQANNTLNQLRQYDASIMYKKPVKTSLQVFVHSLLLRSIFLKFRAMDKL